jgi:hypothetical protein
MVLQGEKTSSMVSPGLFVGISEKSIFGMMIADICGEYLGIFGITLLLGGGP